MFLRFPLELDHIEIALIIALAIKISVKNGLTYRIYRYFSGESFIENTLPKFNSLSRTEKARNN